MNKYWEHRLSENMPFDMATKLMNNLTYYYITREEYSGFLFKNHYGETCILLKTGEVLINPAEIQNTDKDDWFNVSITKDALMRISKQTDLDGLENFEYNDLWVSFDPNELTKDKVISYIDGIDATSDCIMVYLDEDNSLEWC
ncbi:MAG: hypothetical protein ACRDD7_11860 [Peptostreptococcaceae bacterium]